MRCELFAFSINEDGDVSSLIIPPGSHERFQHSDFPDAAFVFDSRRFRAA